MFQPISRVIQNVEKMKGMIICTISMELNGKATEHS